MGEGRRGGGGECNGAIYTAGSAGWVTLLQCGSDSDSVIIGIPEAVGNLPKQKARFRSYGCEAAGRGRGKYAREEL